MFYTYIVFALFIVFRDLKFIYIVLCLHLFVTSYTLRLALTFFEMKFIHLHNV